MTPPRPDQSPRQHRPPRWAEAVLRAMLTPEDAETVSGDLLEVYRDSVRPSRGHLGANVWFVGQVAGFAWRATWVWGLLLATLILGRNALDWFVPPADFMTRSIVTTYGAMSLFLVCGGLIAYRTRSLRASAAAGLAIGVIAAPIKIVGALVLLAIWHDPQTRMAIDRSGGLAEVFALPLFLLLPGALLALAGGLVGKAAAWSFRPRGMQ
ncbi:MAG: hypothetical protein A3H97_15155 [Acidobacteria bacterium RIFCSPLOWO2_02_FULL_65_29]|nr:MAG: hypothetical protein A3H97_15155 [Acidobacteria bacterium RIFCSPLOWO2_02_FULL_65_29]